MHWIVELNALDEKGNDVYLQDIMHSIKRYSANLINISLNKKGTLWHKESFDTTIRDDKHLLNAIEYTINNPVAAGLVQNWESWKGTRLFYHS